jgi:hypothetical protein
MLNNITSSNKNIELLNRLSRMIVDASKDPKATEELTKNPEVKQIPGLSEKILQAKGNPVELEKLAMELDTKSKQLFERPKATAPADPKNPTETKDNPEKGEVHTSTMDQYNHVIDPKDTNKESYPADKYNQEKK